MDYVGSSPEAESVACVEPDAEAREAVSREVGPGVETFERLEDALGAVESDAALVASPSPLHADQAILALDAGLGVMIEKPFAPDVADAKRVIAKSREAGRPVVVAEQFRYVPAERTVRQAVADGMLGDVSNVSFTDRRRMAVGDHGPWVAQLQHPQLQEIAVHHFDSLLAFFGKRPEAVTARAWNPAGSDYAGGACTQAILEMQDGIHVEYMGTLTSNKFSYRLRIEGDGGDLWTNRKYVLYRKRGGKLFKPLRGVKVPKGDERPYPMEGMTSLFRSFCGALNDGTEAETAGSENVWAIAMMQAAVRSDREKRTVALSEVYADPA